MQAIKWSTWQYIINVFPSLFSFRENCVQWDDKGPYILVAIFLKTVDHADYLVLFFFFFPRVLHDANSFFGCLCIFLRLYFTSPLHGALHLFFVSLFFMFFFCAFCLLGFLMLEKTLSTIYFQFIVLYFFVARA